MDVSQQRPHLPALGLLDIDTIKREPDAMHRDHNAPPSALPPDTASPPHLFRSTPTPFSSSLPNSRNPQSTGNAWSSATLNPANSSPSESRRASGDNKEESKPLNGHSLPSISEALGVESQAVLKKGAAPLPPARPSHSTANSTTPSPASRRSFLPEPSHNGLHHANGSILGTSSHSHYAPYRPDPTATASGAPSELRRPSFPPTESKALLPLQMPPATSAQSQAPSYASATNLAPAHPESAAPLTRPSSISSQTPFGNQTYSGRFVNSTPGLIQTSGYPPLSDYVATPKSNTWHSDNSPPYATRPLEPRKHRDSVKRHLDFYDFEMALNDMSQSSSSLSDFCRRYSELMHQTQRTGPSISLLPSIVEIDDMIKKSQCQYETLLKIRDVIVAQQLTYNPPSIDVAKQPPMHTHESSQPLQSENAPPDFEEVKLGAFPYADKKQGKRFGRAPPPGRCHSCNRAETPEWRRGPDGARTLCNACGLHYAKLTRKNNHANKTTSANSSNLRPKEAFH